MNKASIFITRKIESEALKEWTETFEVKMWEYKERPVPRAILLEEAAKANALLIMLSDKMDRELLDVAKNLKVIANLAVGYDNIDVPAATEKGITVCHTPDVLTDTLLQFC